MNRVKFLNDLILRVIHPDVRLADGDKLVIILLIKKALAFENHPLVRWWRKVW